MEAGDDQGLQRDKVARLEAEQAWEGYAAAIMPKGNQS